MKYCPMSGALPPDALRYPCAAESDKSATVGLMVRRQGSKRTELWLNDGRKQGKGLLGSGLNKFVAPVDEKKAVLEWENHRISTC